MGQKMQLQIGMKQQLRMTQQLQHRRQEQAQWAASLNALSPLAVLGRGYAIPRKRSGAVVRSVKEAAPGEEIRLTVSDGTFSCVVNGKGSAADGGEETEL